MNHSILDRATMLDALRVAGVVPPNGSGFTLCPFHADDKPSLHLVGQKGRETGYRCFGCGAAGGIFDFLVETQIAIDHAHAAQILEERMGDVRAQVRVVDSFLYDDGAENTVARVDRIEPGRSGRDKDFLPYLAIGGGFAEKPGLNGTRLPLYHRGEVLQAAGNGGTIFLVEGEGKADVLREALRESRSAAAVTTIASGANTPIRDEHVADFAGAKKVVVLPDSDAPGRAAAELRALRIAGSYRSTEVRIVDLFPDRTDGADIADWLHEGRTLVELKRLTASARVIEPAAHQQVPESSPLVSASGALSDDGFATVDAADLLQRPYAAPRFLVEHLIPERAITLLSADTGAGKSSFLLHTALSIAFALPVAGRFGVAVRDAPLLYLNGEMSIDVLTRFLHANAAGIGVDVADLPKGRLLFEGDSGLTDFFLGFNDRGPADRLEQLLERMRPAVLVLDTFRALFEADESKTKEVRTVFAWLRTLTERFNCSIAVAHHIRKLSQVSNGARERVSGSRDLIGAVDVHVALRSLGGQPANYVLIDKTRMPSGGVSAGTEWPLQASWLDGEPPQSRFAAGEPTRQNTAPIETAQQEILDVLNAEGPKTIADLGANGGSRKRALEALRENGSVIVVGKSGRAVLLGVKSARENLFEID
jgi:putative DNA primase/helicase